MRQRRMIWGAFLLIGLAVGSVLIWAFRPSDDKAATKPLPAMSDATDAPMGAITLSAEAVARGGIETVAVTRQSLSESLEATGRIQINQDASARAGSPVEGRVTRVLATVGDRVSAGQPLVYIRSHELMAARADYKKAKTSVVRAEKNLQYAKAELERANRLLEAKAISQREQLRAVADVTAAEAELEQARAELRRAEEFLHHLGASPEAEAEVTIRAPIAGVVLQRNVTIGAVVNPADDLMIISDLSTLWVVAEVPERQAAFVRLRQPVEVTVAAFPDARFPGRVVYIGESLDPQTRTVQVRCSVENRQQQLRPEMYATIHIGVGQTSPVLVVPSEAVQELQGERVVFIDRGQGRFEKRVVEPGRTVGDLTEIVRGLEVGQRVVARGSFLIKSEFLKGTIEEE